MRGADGLELGRRLGTEIGALTPVPFEQLGPDSLMDRVDTRFTLPFAAVPGLLGAAGSYRVLEVEGRRINGYETIYFDTPDLRFYHEHHAGKSPRYKVRVRRYLESGQTFVEVKRRALGGRTSKTRLPWISEPSDEAVRAAVASLPGAPADLPGGLGEVLRVGYWRITLVRDDAVERVTLDFEIRFRHGADEGLHPGLVIAELKQERSGPSPFLDIMRRVGHRPGGLSKYCLGVATLCRDVRKNRFSRSLSLIHRVSSASATVARRA